MHVGNVPKGNPNGQSLLKFSPSLVLMDDGRILESGNPREVLANPGHEAAGSKFVASVALIWLLFVAG